MAESHFDEWIAKRFHLLWPELFEPGVVEPAVELLAEMAGTGSALEFGIRTGRIAVPLSQRGVRVQGIELSTAMVAQLRTQHDTSSIDVTIGDFATTKVDGSFSLVYLLRNTITNLITQDEQLEAFRNAAAHLEPGGRFVIENYVPELRRLPAGETIHVFTATPTHLGFEDYDTANQTAISHHYWVIDGQLEQLTTTHRYMWPAELDLMARMAGLILAHRWSGWDRAAFTSEPEPHLGLGEGCVVAAHGKLEPRPER
jgi:SAM-dependent methyltransferase